MVSQDGSVDVDGREGAAGACADANGGSCGHRRPRTSEEAAHSQSAPDSARLVAFLVHDVAYFLSHRLPVAQEAQKRGYRVVVLGEGAAASPDLAAYGMDGREIAFRRGGVNLRGELRSLRSIRHQLRACNPDLVHAVALKGALYGGLLTRFSAAASVLAPTGLGYVFTDDGWRARTLRRVLIPLLCVAFRGRRRIALFQNRDDTAIFTGMGAVRSERVAVVQGAGVDLEAFKPSPEPPSPPTVVVMPARLVRHKGVEEFVEAAQRLKHLGLPVRLRIAGDSDPENPTAVDPAWIARIQEAGDVELMGRQSDMAAVYRGCHIVCLPSYREGLPKALLEASACGRPMVATDVPGCRDVVAEGETGYLVPLGDIAGLVNALRTLAEDSHLRARFGAAARTRAERLFSKDSIAVQTVNLYDDLLAESIRAEKGPVT
ncbi:hypothetical protein CKO28_15660 [Rhodovibrio sodomensis]|uniref:Glycosyltransferase family 1 protein n=1 Tax=Rhodovibrio sodomensis TaxID=1088 RepID=A0ABS1DG94_9PROT|nr:glycosyltransferase family 4 protein [Rhodovibrio sodomensis]MBK1669475.1 hypothetical protein [Rhodovibrio sodomensis]